MTRFETLQYRQRRLLEMRYGWNGEEPHTLDEIAEHFGITSERVRQIEAQGWAKLERCRDELR